jgi:hypothetical protein
MQQCQFLFIIRHDNGATMWLKRELPLVWGDRADAKRYRTKGDAMRTVVRIKVHSKITLEAV